jgi:hypothetical protein
MTLCTARSHASLGNLGVFSVAVIAFALTTLQGCAGATVTASSAREPGGAIAGLGALGVDPPARVAERQPPERVVSERAESRAREPRTVSMDTCIRCR